MLDSFFNATLGKLFLIPDVGGFPVGLFLISFILTLIVTIIYKYTTNQEKLRENKKEMKELQAQMKANKDNPTKMMEIQKVMWEKNMATMKEGFKPMIFTFIPVIFIFSWLRSYYTGLGDPKVLFGLSWIWAYIIFSIIINLILRKVMKIV